MNEQSPIIDVSQIPGMQRNPRLLTVVTETLGVMQEAVPNNASLRAQLTPEDVYEQYANIVGDTATALPGYTDAIIGDQPIKTVPTTLLREILNAETPKDVRLGSHNYGTSTYHPIGLKTMSWTRPYGRKEIRLHKAATLAATLAASFIGTGVVSASAEPGDVPLLPSVTWTNEGVTNLGNTYNRTSTISGPRQELRSRVDTPSTPTQIPAKYISVGNEHTMAVAGDFWINSPKELAVPTEDLEKNVQEVARLLQQGYSLDSIEVTGLASDEAQIHPNAGLGVSDQENVALAEKRAELIKAAVVSLLDSHAIAYADAKVTLASKEHVLTATEAALMQEVLPKYWRTPELLSPQERLQLEQLIESKRGGFVRFGLSRPAETVPHGSVTEVTECVNEERVDITVTPHDVPYRNEHDIIFLLVPIPILRRDKWPKEPKKYVEYRIPESDELEPMAETPSGPGESPQGEAMQEEVTAGDPPTPLPSAQQRPVASRFDKWIRHRQQKRLQHYYAERRMTPGEKRSRAIRRGIGIGGVALLALLSIRGDVGYCPNPEDHEQQSLHWGEFPAYFSAGLGIPLTDIETPKITLLDAACPAGDTPPPTTVPTPKPCSQRTLVYVNGHLTETHFDAEPGAVTKTTTDY